MSPYKLTTCARVTCSKDAKFTSSQLQAVPKKPNGGIRRLGVVEAQPAGSFCFSGLDCGLLKDHQLQTFLLKLRDAYLRWLGVNMG